MSSLLSNPTGNEMHVPFQKSSCRPLMLHLVDQVWVIDLSLNWSLHQSNWLCSAGKVWSEDGFYSKEIQAFFFFFFFPYKKVMDAGDTKHINKQIPSNSPSVHYSLCFHFSYILIDTFNKWKCVHLQQIYLAFIISGAPLVFQKIKWM